MILMFLDMVRLAQACGAWIERVPGVSEQGRIYASENTLTLMVQIAETHEPVLDSKTKEKAQNKITVI